jgi:hypothetical protein
MVIVFGMMRVEFEPPAGSAVQNTPETCTVCTPTPASFGLIFSRSAPGEAANPIQLGLFVLDGNRELPVFRSTVKAAEDRVRFEMPRGTLIVRASQGEQQAKLVLVHTDHGPTWTEEVLSTTPG